MGSPMNMEFRSPHASPACPQRAACQVEARDMAAIPSEYRDRVHLSVIFAKSRCAREDGDASRGAAGSGSGVRLPKLALRRDNSRLAPCERRLQKEFQ
jgi:hypothetical protein